MRQLARRTQTRPPSLPGPAVAVLAPALAVAWWALVAPVLGQVGLASAGGALVGALALAAPAAGFAWLGARGTARWARVGAGLLLAPAAALAGLVLLPSLMLWSLASGWLAGAPVQQLGVDGGTVSLHRGGSHGRGTGRGFLLQRRQVGPGLWATWVLAGCPLAVDARLRTVDAGGVEVTWVLPRPDGGQRLVGTRLMPRGLPTWATTGPPEVDQACLPASAGPRAPPRRPGPALLSDVCPGARPVPGTLLAGLCPEPRQVGWP